NILKYSPDIDNKSNQESLKIAVFGYAKKVVEALLEYGFSVIPEDANNRELFRSAVEKGYVKIVDDFLKYGANVNMLFGRSRNGKGLTPLHIAVIIKQVEMANLLISNEADINARNKKGKTPLIMLISSGQFYGNQGHSKLSTERLSSTLMRTLFWTRHNTSQTMGPLYLPSTHIPKCNNILKYSPDIDNKSNQESLKIAVFGYAKKVVEALLEYGFSVIPEDANNRELFRSAVEKGYVKIVDDFLKYGANVNMLFGRSRNGKGLTPLHIAVIIKQVEMANLLISNEADINARNKKGKTPLIMLISSGQFYGNHGARVNSQDNDGRTALHYACINGFDESVEELLEHGSDINITCKDGRKALDLYLRDALSETCVKLIGGSAFFIENIPVVQFATEQE
ncbi:hypothetical protein QYM36_016161, partial [Artemia franciscana]